jgi:hypothetical protein
MIINFSSLSNWFNPNGHHARQKYQAEPLQVVYGERPNLRQLSRQPDLQPHFVVECPVTQKYLRLLGPLDWGNFPERPSNRAWPGPRPLLRAPFVAAYLIKLDQQKRYMSDLRAYLLEHPPLVWALGFPLTPSETYSWGFDLEASLPTPRLFLAVLRKLDNAALQFLLDSTVEILKQELPASVNFGQTVAVDTKHIIAWVKENNPKAFIKEGRYDKNKQPRADRDCRLGVKKRSNQSPKKTQSASDLPPTPTTKPRSARTVMATEAFWGYASGVVATKIPGWGEFILAEYTQTFDKNDITYFAPLMAHTERRLGFRPPYGALDAAFDAFYVYDYFDQAGGFAAVPLSKRGNVERSFDDQGRPLCQAGLAMPLKATFICRTTAVQHQRGRYACPLLYPQQSQDACPVSHKKWPKGGCLVTMATNNGARIRYQLDRKSDAYKQLYNQRTSTERINSLAVELGIERPKLRNQRSITNQNTLIYILLNLRAIQRVQAKKVALARQAHPISD